jgi:eukaryotic-like serine/threonine-protein kinase
MPDATPDRWKRIEELYRAALARPPAERGALLTEVEPEIRREVEALLEREDPAAAVTVTQVDAGGKFGHYRLESRIGAGGMGEVYRAIDTRLGRKVAIKINNEQFSARFEREARAISALNHPNICTLYDVGPNYLVMEFVEGETLSAKLKDGALSPELTARYAEQVASALAEAHSKDIIHRDLKPGNIMVTKNGVKVLDFGLAKFTRSAGADEGEPLTASAAIVGTVPYMAPEQLEGKPGDVRTDIFSMGLVLCEMATGRRVFTGASQAAIIAEVLKCQAPSLDDVPEALADVIRGCLHKDAEQRWQSAREVLIALRFASGRAPTGTLDAPPRPGRNREWFPWAVAGLLGLTTVALAISRLAAPTASQEQISFQISPPGGGAFTVDHPELNIMAISPDGLRVAMSANVDGKFQIWIRDRDNISARLLPGTEDGVAPFWSPDSRSVAFFADGKLKRVDLAGGPPRTICDVSATARTGTWGSGNDILFSEQRSENGGIFQVSAEGGSSRRVAAPNTARKERAVLWPEFLPDGKHFLYMAWMAQLQHTIYAASVTGGEPKLLVQAPSKAQYASPGYLLFAKEGSLLGQKFDPDALQLTGSPVPIAERIEFFPPSGLAAFSVSSNGVLAYQSASRLSKLAWMDRSGRELGVLVQGGAFQDIRLSPDGKKVVANKADERIGSSDLYITELASGNSTRITSDQGNEFAGVWSPDGRRIVFAWDHNAIPFLHEMDLDNSGAPEAIDKPTDGPQIPFGWLPDGSILYQAIFTETNADILLLPPGKGIREPRKLLSSRFSEMSPAISPDVHWLAYTSDDTGRPEVYVRSFPQMGAPHRISNAGGDFARWARNGRELYYIEGGNRLIGVPTRLAPDFEAAAPSLVFQASDGIVDFDPAPDGRFVVNIGNVNYMRSPISVVINWTAKLNGR